VAHGLHYGGGREDSSFEPDAVEEVIFRLLIARTGLKSDIARLFQVIRGGEAEGRFTVQNRPVVGRRDWLRLRDGGNFGTPGYLACDEREAGADIPLLFQSEDWGLN
jgi:hypothetical protein